MSENCQEVSRLQAGIDKARRLTASDPDNPWCRQATIILNALLVPARPVGDMEGNAQGDPNWQPSSEQISKWTCKSCGKLITQQDQSYGISPDSICMCGE